MIRDYFIEAVAKNRNMSIDSVKKYADGAFMLGKEAFDYGLIDELGGQKQAIEYIESQLNITAEISLYEPPKSIWNELAGVFADNFYSLGEGLGTGLKQRSSIIV